jgi:hypothetical protein
MLVVWRPLLYEPEELVAPNIVAVFRARGTTTPTLPASALCNWSSLPSVRESLQAFGQSMHCQDKAECRCDGRGNGSFCRSLRSSIGSTQSIREQRSELGDSATICLWGNSREAEPRNPAASSPRTIWQPGNLKDCCRMPAENPWRLTASGPSVQGTSPRAILIPMMRQRHKCTSPPAPITVPCPDTSRLFLANSSKATSSKPDSEPQGLSGGMRPWFGRIPL